ncbi:RDD family protein [Niallia sp. 01092]|uniref:RDD family protein n=1 Tax=unclassified Niallia TaxID=2837522 RepID=UPI003FD323FD
MDINMKQETQLEEKNYAGFWIRFGASVIDSIILAIPLLILSNFLFALFLGSSEEALLSNPVMFEQEPTEEELMAFIGPFLGAAFGTAVVCILISSLYYVILQSSKWQATIGKKLLGLKVMTLNGDKISFWRSLARYLVLGFLSGIFYIGYIMAAFTEKKQALHDLIAGTIVVKSK